jgi:quercetin dioxygenase-like cupin family protein
MTEHNPDAKNMQIIKPQSLPAKAAPVEHFTGSVHLTPLVMGEEPSCLTCASVSFDPSARSAWHTHPRGQLLIVTNGSGLIQEWGKPISKIQKGDVIWTPPGVKHWHGAAPSSGMTHTAIQEAVNGKNVEWLEKVTDEEYMRPAN